MDFVGFNLTFMICMWGAISCLIFTILFAFWQIKASDYDSIWRGIVATVTGIIAGCLFLTAAIIAFPFQGERYYSVYQITGNVTDISNVLTEDGGELARSIIIQLDSYDEPITMNNPRNISLAGKNVTLTCEYEFVPYAMDNTVCDLRSLN